MSEPHMVKTDAELALAQTFAAAKAKLPGDLAARREAAFDRFAQQGLPHRRVEEWKYTDLRALMHDAKPLARVPDAAAKARAKAAGAALAAINARRLVFADGAFVAELSDLAALETGLKITSLADALTAGTPSVIARLGRAGAADGDVAFALNTAFMGDGVVIEIASGAKIARPIYCVFAMTGEKAAATFSRSLIVVGNGAAVTLIESHEGRDGVDDQVNTALDLDVGDGAVVEHVKLATDGNAALHLATLTAVIGANAQFRDFTFTTGGAVMRNQLFVRTAGTGSTLTLSGASLLQGSQHADNT
jgi:Fe-S cluster assembly protein SufD